MARPGPWNRSLRARFVLAGILLALLTVGTGLGSVWMFVRLGRVVDGTLRDSQATIDRAAELAGSLEREDDAVLLALSGDSSRARRELAEERLRGQRIYEDLAAREASAPAPIADLIRDLPGPIAAYRGAVSALLEDVGRPDAFARYHAEVNPLLRRAVQACGTVRERNFEVMRLAGVRARDESQRATWVVAAACLGALALATLTAAWLARSVVVPVQRLRGSMEALREGDFDRRFPLDSRRDELGQLAAGFNRMAETLSEYRRSSLGELLAVKSTLEATLDALPDAVIVVAPDGGLALMNSPAREVLLALGVPEAIGVRDLPLSADQRAAVESALAGRAVPPSRADFGKAIQVPIEGRPRKFLVSSVPIPEFVPRRCGAAVVLGDVTEFARLDELRSELVAVASHELKTPLTTLRMSLMLLSEGAGAMAPRSREMLDTALLGCEELGVAVDELLDVARIEAGQLRLELGTVDLESTAASVLRLFQDRFDDASIRFEVRCESRPALVVGDAARLRTVIANLLSNALKYSPPGGVVLVRIASGQNARVGGRGTLQFAVTDSGPGVPGAFRERVFEKFFRVEHHMDRGPKAVHGTGIGLYLCREIVRAHGGSIRCEPAAGGTGTTFVFEMVARG